MSEATSLFGAVRMGYVLVESRKLDDWDRFLKEGLGLHRAHADPSALAYRIDGHARRLIVRRGPAEDLVAIGWHVKDEPAMALVLERLKERGIGVETGSAEEAAFRGVTSFVRIRGPKDTPIELFTDAVMADEPLDMLTSGFVTGHSGMGHAAITTRRPQEMQRFWQEIFDARVSDHIAQGMGGIMLDIVFLRLNARHHSIAIAATRGLRLDPIGTKVQHLNLEAARLDDVSAAFGRLTGLGYEMAREIGQHPNDRELSFYVVTPSGFELELGWNALAVDETAWKPASYDAISLWGHKPRRNSTFRKIATNLGNLRRGLRSLLKPEFSPL